MQAAALGWGARGNTCQLRSPAVLLALLLRVELVPVALAAPIAEGDAFALGCIKGPACHRCLAGTWDNGQPAGSCRDRSCVRWGGPGTPTPPTWMAHVAFKAMLRSFVMPQQRHRPRRDSHPRSGMPADTPFLSRSCCHCPDSLHRGKFHKPWRRSCRRSGRASRCRAQDPGSGGTSLGTSTPRVTGKRECSQGDPHAAPALGTYLPYCQCKWAGVLQLSPPPGAALLSGPSAPGRKHRAAISPCLWDLLLIPQGGLCQRHLRLRPSSVLPVCLQPLI